MGIFKNAGDAVRMQVALAPLVNAATEAEFRSHLPAAIAAGQKVYGTGRRLSFEGSIKDRILSAAAAPMAAEKLLAQGNFVSAKFQIAQAFATLNNLSG